MSVAIVVISIFYLRLFQISKIILKTFLISLFIISACRYSSLTCRPDRWLSVVSLYFVKYDYNAENTDQGNL